MKLSTIAVALLLLSALVPARAHDASNWNVLVPGQSYAVRPVESKPFIVLAAVRGTTLSEPVNLGFYVLSSPACRALAPSQTGNLGTVGTVEIDGKDYGVEGECDAGNLTMVPSFWAARKLLMQSVKKDAVLAVKFKMGSGFDLHYRTAGFGEVLADLNN